MRRSSSHPARSTRLFIPAAVAIAALVACSDRQPVAPSEGEKALPPASALAAFQCEGTTAGTVTCRPVENLGGAGSRVTVGGQNVYLKLTSGNVSYDGVAEIFSFDVTVQNLMNEAIGTPDGTLLATDGIRVFFESGPTVTEGTGAISVANADGTGTFTAANQPYFQYDEILAKNAVSSARTWQFSLPATATAFSFGLFVETDVQYLLVINELLSNPVGTISDANGEWFEIYNAGTRRVNLENLVIADSSPAGRRPYHLISGSLIIPAGGYMTLGNTTNATNNGGVAIDYAYGAALAFTNSLDAVKIARVYGTDTLTIDRTQYASGSISAQNGISRELKSTVFDNQDMDGTNWGDADVSAVYGPGGRGTPKAQNSTFQP